MSFRELINEFKNSNKTLELHEDEDINNKEYEEKESNQNDDSYYFNMVNPDTGKRYDIPMLSPIDPDYYYQYVNYMKIKETSPDTFEKILNWD